MVQRVLQAMVLDARRFKRHAHTMPPKWGNYVPGDVLAWTSSRNGYTTKKFIVTATTIVPNGNVIHGFQEIDSSDNSWTPATDEQALTFAPLTVIKPAAIPMTGWSVVATTFKDSGGVDRRPAISVSYAGGMTNISNVRIQIREHWGSQNVIYDSGDQLYDPTEGSTITRTISWPGILQNSVYDVRGIFIAMNGQDSSWSSWLSVTTPDVGLARSDFNASVQQFMNQTSLQIRDLTQQMQLVTALAGEQDAANFDDRNYALRQIKISKNNLTAAYTEAILVALGADGTALTDAITAVEAANGDISAGLVTRMTALASPGGGWVRYGMQARVSSGYSFPVTAGFFLEVKTDGTSRIGLLAEDTVFYTSDGTAIAAISATGIFGSVNGVVQLNMITGAFSITV
jgi:hypothetical protein